MARAATTSDVFNAIAEPQRREILVLLRAGERPVTELAQELGMTRPGASKHLRVLREVGLVRDRKARKQRLYSLDARGLRPVHEWTGGFEGVDAGRVALEPVRAEPTQRVTHLTYAVRER
jgi:DNA-binding transcriptional ArsR family regulator